MANVTCNDDERGDGTAHALVESSAEPPRIIEIGGEPIVVFDGKPPAPSVPAEDVYANGPGGRVHAFLHRPDVGSAPLPTVFTAARLPRTSTSTSR